MKYADFDSEICGFENLNLCGLLSHNLWIFLESADFNEVRSFKRKTNEIIKTVFEKSECMLLFSFVKLYSFFFYSLHCVSRYGYFLTICEVDYSCMSVADG